MPLTNACTLRGLSPVSGKVWILSAPISPTLLVIPAIFLDILSLFCTHPNSSVWCLPFLLFLKRQTEELTKIFAFRITTAAPAHTFASNFAFSLRTFAENHLPSSILGSSVWWFPLLIQSLTRFSSSSLFPLNFNLLHFNHRFNWPTVYSSGSLSNLEPGTSSSSVRTVKDTFPLQPLKNWRLFVWLTTGY